MEVSVTGLAVHFPDTAILYMSHSWRTMKSFFSQLGYQKTTTILSFWFYVLHFLPARRPFFKHDITKLTHFVVLSLVMHQHQDIWNLKWQCKEVKPCSSRQQWMNALGTGSQQSLESSHLLRQESGDRVKRCLCAAEIWQNGTCLRGATGGGPHV